MADSAERKKPTPRARRYLIDCPSQLTFGVLTLCVMGGIGLLYACAVFVLTDSVLLQGRTVNEVRGTLLAVHTAYFVVGGAILYVTVVLLTHRYVGPGLVMRRALRRMRRGDFSARLTLRRRDFQKDVVEEVRLLRDELAERDAAQVESLKHLETCLDEGNLDEARRLVRELFAQSAAERSKRGARPAVEDAAKAA